MSEAHWVFAIIAMAAIAMASNRVRYDVIALTVIVLLVVSGILDINQGVAGFGHPVVILVGCLLIVGEMLDKTGIARGVGDWILKKGGHQYWLLIALLMFSAAGLSSVMSSTAVVAIFIPIVLRIAEVTGLGKSQMLLPVSFAALISGMITLIATPPNLVINSQLLQAGLEGLGFLSFAPLGLIVLAVAIAFFVVFGQRLLPDHSAPKGKNQDVQRSFVKLWADFHIGEQLAAIRLTNTSPLCNMTLAQSQLNSRFGTRVLARIQPSGRNPQVQGVDPQLTLQQGDILLITAPKESIDRLCREAHCDELEDMEQHLQGWLWKLGASVILIHPDSSLVGQSLVSSQFRSMFGAQVMGIKRRGELVDELQQAKLDAGDMLFVVSTWDKLEKLTQRSHELILLETPKEYANTETSLEKAPLALAIVAVMVALKVLAIVPLTIAAMLAAVASVLTGCLSVQQAYRSVSWSSLVLIAGMLPLATALSQTGGTDMIIQALMQGVGSGSPYLLLAALFAVTAVMTMVLSNTASAVLLAPIAIGAAQSLNLSPYPFAIAVLMGASAAFASPVSTPVVTLVVEPGKYKFSDFLKAGLPLLFVTGTVTVFAAPLLFPF